jgi:hypothetical protein
MSGVRGGNEEAGRTSTDIGAQASFLASPLSRLVL